MTQEDNDDRPEPWARARQAEKGARNARLDALLDEWETQYGPIPEETMLEMVALWPEPEIPIGEGDIREM